MSAIGSIPIIAGGPDKRPFSQDCRQPRTSDFGALNWHSLDPKLPAAFGARREQPWGL